jgi:small subunit ribosomal protein S35
LASSEKPKTFLSQLDDHKRAIYDSMSDVEKADYEAEGRLLEEHFAQPDVQARMRAAVSSSLGELSRQSPAFREERMGKYKPGFMSLGEEPSDEIGPDPEFEEDDISSIAHGDLEQHRELREYARLAAWEMPLLASAYKKFARISADDTY